MDYYEIMTETNIGLNIVHHEIMSTRQLFTVYCVQGYNVIHVYNYEISSKKYFPMKSCPQI